ncbi:MAG: Holliday junction resolvase [Bacteroidetes bacterium]|jgi:putative Holliday junction resolvase|nr:Holliday junction resolvase [Bacteroidota bacterium]
MGRILAIDYGTKRTGLAVTDPLKIIASGLQTVETKGLLTFLDQYLLKEQVECVVVGEPKTVTNEDSAIAPRVNEFIKKFSQKHPQMKIERMDERFTSKIAQQTMLAGGLKKKDRQNKATVDMVSATIILQDYMMLKGI